MCAPCSCTGLLRRVNVAEKKHRPQCSLTRRNLSLSILFCQINQYRSRGQQGYKYAAGEIKKKGRDGERERELNE